MAVGRPIGLGVAGVVGVVVASTPVGKQSAAVMSGQLASLLLIGRATPSQS